MQVGYVVLYVNDTEVCRGFWVDQVGMVEKRRSEAGIPEEIIFRKKWELALEIIDQIRAWGLPDRVVLGDAGYGDGTEFREELERRELKYAVGVLPQVGVWLKSPKIIPLKTTGKGRPRTASR